MSVGNIFGKSSLEIQVGDWGVERTRERKATKENISYLEFNTAMKCWEFFRLRRQEWQRRKWVRIKIGKKELLEHNMFGEHPRLASL